MDSDDQRDPDEERYVRDLCPMCDYSPCRGGKGKGSCEPSRRLEVDIDIMGLTPTEVARILQDVGISIMREDWSGNVIIDGERIGGWSLAEVR